MDFYFSLDALLDRVEAAAAQSTAPSVTLVPVSTTGSAAELFIAATTPRLLNFDSDSAPHDFAALLTSVPLYHVNTELVLDEALSARENNHVIRKALDQLADEIALPAAGLSEPGQLRHPGLGHMDNRKISHFYTGFVRALCGRHAEYGFSEAILKAHTKPFLDQYDGYLQGGSGLLRADILLKEGIRRDLAADRPLETYLESGSQKAQAMNIHDPQELIWAWMEADEEQRRRCLDIHRILRLAGARPRWIKGDIFSLLEMEAMKQCFASALASVEPGLSRLDDAPLLKKSVNANASGQANELLQHMLAQILNKEAGYAGAAGKFADAAEKRRREFQRLRA